MNKLPPLLRGHFCLLKHRPQELKKTIQHTRSCSYSTTSQLAHNNKKVDDEAVLDSRLFFLRFDAEGNQCNRRQYEELKTNGGSDSIIRKEPLLFMHGLLGSSQNYVSLINNHHPKLLNGKREAFLMDCRNHGRSLHTKSMTYDDLADDILNLCSEQQLEKVNLIGHSMSGKAIMNMLLRETMNGNEKELLNKFNKIVVVDISPVDYTQDSRWVIQNHINAMKGIDLSKLKTRSQAEIMLKDLSKGTISKDVRLFLLTNLVRKSLDDNTIKWEWRCNLDVIEEHLIQIGSFPFKTRDDPLGIYSQLPPIQYMHDNIMFLRGENSMYVTDKYEEITKLFFPKAKFLTIKNASHWVHADNPADFATSVHGFIGNPHFP